MPLRSNDHCCKVDAMVVTIITEDRWAYPRLIPRVWFGGGGGAPVSTLQLGRQVSAVRGLSFHAVWDYYTLAAEWRCAPTAIWIFVVARQGNWRNCRVQSSMGVTRSERGKRTCLRSKRAKRFAWKLRGDVVELKSRSETWAKIIGG